MVEQATYRHDLGNGLYLDAFSLDPNLGQERLEEIVRFKDGKVQPDLQGYISGVDYIGYIRTLSEIGVVPVDESYQVPQQLRAYRNALAQKLDARGQFNGSIAIIQPPLQIPIKFFREGRYYDYQATALNDVPGNLLPELLNYKAEDLFLKRFSLADTEEKFKARYDPRLVDRFRAKSLDEFLRIRGLSPELASLFREKTIGELLIDNHSEISRAFNIEVQEIEALQRAQYPKGKTIKQLLTNAGLGIESAARYLAFAFIMMPDNGREVSFVYRSPYVGIAPDVMSISGSTPPFTPKIFEPGFNLGFYEGDHLVNQMNHEYGLKKEEYEILGMYAIDDRNSIPALAIEIKTPATTREIAKRIFGKERAIKEHPVLFGHSPQATNTIINRFPLFPPVVYIFDLFNRRLKA